MNKEISVFAQTTYRNEFKKFGIKTDDRRRHMYLIGKTGMGKSTVLENMIVDDIRAGHGVAVSSIRMVIWLKRLLSLFPRNAFRMLFILIHRILIFRLLLTLLSRLNLIYAI